MSTQTINAIRMIVLGVFFSYPMLLMGTLLDAVLVLPPLIVGYYMFISKKMTFMIVAPRHIMSAIKDYASSPYIQDNIENIELIVYHESADEFMSHVDPEEFQIEDYID